MIYLSNFKKLELLFNINLYTQIAAAVIFYLIDLLNRVPLLLIDLTFLPIIILLIVTTGVIISKYIYALRSKINEDFPFDKKLSMYISYSVQIIILLDVIFVFNLISFLFTGGIIYFAVAALILLLSVIYRPSRYRFNKDILKEEEKLP